MHEDLSRYDPPNPLSYITLIETAFPSFHGSDSLEAFLARLGVGTVTDIAAAAEFRATIEAPPPLPPEFQEHFFFFRDPRLGRGTFDVAFGHQELLNFRGQLFFPGTLGRFRSQRYFRTVLVPLYQRLMGPAVQRSGKGVIFEAERLSGLARHVRAAASVSAWLTDQCYV